MRQFVAEGLVLFDQRYNEFSLLVRQGDGIQVCQKIDFCPWSGDKLPQSLRDRWFDELEAQGIDPMNDPIPERYQDARWRREVEHGADG
ncbi:hypothetical protein AZA_87673 [Nitrospirillum viridazoti Y2]|nr:hypothetical protein AZA_87673 [Nitrospirillum amazonense Y2]